MKQKITRDQLVSLLSERISHQLSKLSLERTKRGLENILEGINMDDFLDGQSAARQDITGEFGNDEWAEFGSTEDPKAFIGSMSKANEKGVDANASAWKEHYSTFNEEVTNFLTSDPQLASYSTENAHEFLDAMALGMYKYMMDHNSNSPFISSIQQWIIDLDDTYDPTDEETGEIQMDPVSWRIYKMLGKFDKQYNRRVLGKKASRAALNEQRQKLKGMLSVIREAWEWGHSPEAYDAARQNLYSLSHETLLDIMSEWDAFEAAGGNSSVMAADFDAVDKTKYARLPMDVLVDAIFEKAEQESNADNGGFHLWMCPYGCNTHKVKTDSVEDTMDESGPYAPMMRGKHSAKETYDWEVLFLNRLNDIIPTKKTHILNKSHKEALKDAQAMIPSVEGAVDVDIQEKHRDLRYEYTINLDERGLFYASVQDEDGKTVYEIKVGYGEDEDNNVFEDGFMKHKHDLDGLEQHLKSMGIMEPDGHDDYRGKDSGATLVASFGKGRRAIDEDIDDMDLDGGDLSDDPQSMDSFALADDVSMGYYVVPPTDEDPYWYVVKDGEPVGDGLSSEEEANAMKNQLESGSGYGTMFKESRLERIDRLTREAMELLKEYSNIPMGADTMDAPWNETEPVPARQKPKTVFSLTDSSRDCIVVHHGGDYYVMDLQGMDSATVQGIAIDYVGVPMDGEGRHDTDNFRNASHLPPEALVDYINGNIKSLKIGNGLSDWKAGMSDLVKVDAPLAQYLKADNVRLSIPV